MIDSEKIQNDNYNFIIEKIINPNMDRVEIMELSLLLSSENKESKTNKKLFELNRKVFFNDLNDAITASDNIKQPMPYDKWLLASGASGVDLSWAVMKMLERKEDQDPTLNAIIENIYKHDVYSFKNIILSESELNDNTKKILSAFLKIMEKTHPEECLKIKKELDIKFLNKSVVKKNKV